MNQRPLLFAFLIILLPLVGVHLLGLNNGPMIALFITVVIFWFTEIIPLAATGLLVPALAILYGLVPAKEAFAPFGNQILFLFIGAFLLAKSMQKHGWDKRMAYLILSSKIGCRSPTYLISFVAIVCWFLSMWISNTAACAIMTPIALGIIATLRDSFEDKKSFNNFSTRLLLICAFASSIGGMATPVGSPPNLLAIQFLNDNGIYINFIEWMMVGLPVSMAMLITLGVIFNIRYPVPAINLMEIRSHFAEKLKSLGCIKKAEIQVALCFALAIVLWILPGSLSMVFPGSEVVKSIQAHLPMGAVAIIASVLLFLMPVSPTSRNLTWDDAKDIDWGTVMLFGGGLCMGMMLNSTGLAKTMGDLLFGSTIESFFAVGGLVILVSILISEFSSNTASAAIVVPILIGTFAAVGEGPLTRLVVAAAFGASFGFMLPVSTPPNAIVFGTGYIPLKQMIKAGVVFDIAGFLIISLFVLYLLPILGVI